MNKFHRNLLPLLCLFILFFVGALNEVKGQDPSAIFDGKIVIGDDATAPQEGSIRYNSVTNTFEGYNGTVWVTLSWDCSCAYVDDPFTDQDDTPVQFDNGSLKFTLDFSHKIDITSVAYGTNIIIAGNQGTSSGGTLIWKNNRTKVEIVTDEAWSDIASCGSTFSITLKGVGVAPLLGFNKLPIDGDRDGCCGGDYVLLFQMPC